MGLFVRFCWTLGFVELVLAFVVVTLSFLDLRRRFNDWWYDELMSLRLCLGRWLGITFFG